MRFDDRVPLGRIWPIADEPVFGAGCGEAYADGSAGIEPNTRSIRDVLAGAI